MRDPEEVLQELIDNHRAIPPEVAESIISRIEAGDLDAASEWLKPMPDDTQETKW